MWGYRVRHAEEAVQTLAPFCCAPPSVRPPINPSPLPGSLAHTNTPRTLHPAPCTLHPEPQTNRVRDAEEAGQALAPFCCTPPVACNRVCGWGIRVWGLRLWVWGLGFEIWGLGVGVEG